MGNCLMCVGGRICDCLTACYCADYSDYYDPTPRESICDIMSHETLAARSACARGLTRCGPSTASGEDGLSDTTDVNLLRAEQAVEALLRRTKYCAKYFKDLAFFIEKRTNLHLEYSKSLYKLSQIVKPMIIEETYLPLQSTYCAALDHDFNNCASSQASNLLILGNKYLEPLNARRVEHERQRKQLKEVWHRELKRMQDAENHKRKMHALYVQRAHAARAAVPGMETLDVTKLERRRKTDDEAVQKTFDAENAYRLACSEADERLIQLQKTKAEILNKLQELLYQFDQTLQELTMNYFEIQRSINEYVPIQAQALYESSSQYEPGTQYTEFSKRFCALASQKHLLEGSSTGFSAMQMDTDPKSLDTLYMEHDFSLNPQGPDGKGFSKKAWSSTSQTGLGSDTDSSHSNKSRESSPTHAQGAASRVVASYSGDELEAKAESVEVTLNAAGKSKAASSHKFRNTTLRGNNGRCANCDTKVYLQAYECTECGIFCHKDCTKNLAILCGTSRLPERVSVFGVDLAQHLSETNSVVPIIMILCIREIEEKYLDYKGIYRKCGLKSRVEKLCQDFETAADRIDLNNANVYDITSVLKLYLRQLPEPLLTFKLYPNFVRLASEWPQEVGENPPANKLQELKELTQNLPIHNFNALATLMRHLHNVILHEELNCMPPKNLGIVFGPTLLRTPEGTTTSYNSLQETVHQTTLIEILIQNSLELFPGPACNIHSNISMGNTRVEEVTSSQPQQQEIVLPGYISENASPQATVKNTFNADFDFHLNQDDAILGFTSDDELPDSFLPDSSPVVPTSPLLQRNLQVNEPIFRGSLKDYRGLEGASHLTLNYQAPEAYNDGPQLQSQKSKSEVPARKKYQMQHSQTGQSSKSMTFSSSSAELDYESHLTRSLFVENLTKDEDKQSVKTDTSGPPSSVDESFSEGERDEPSSGLRRAATLPPSHKDIQQESSKSSSSGSNLIHSTKHHFSVVTNHFVGRRSSSVRSESSSHVGDISKNISSQKSEKNIQSKTSQTTVTNPSKDRKQPTE